MININEFWKKREPKVVYSYVPEPTYRQKDPPEMLRMAVELIASWEASGANIPPVFIPDFGTVTTAKTWGGKVVRSSDGQQIFIEHVSTDIDAILDVQPAEHNPDVAQAVTLYKEVCRQTGRNDIRFVTPDYQGPLNTAAQIMEQVEFLVAMYTEPTKVHTLLDRVTNNLIQYMKDLQAQVPVSGSVWPYMWLPSEFGVSITEDLMPLVSPELYKEFGLPYLKRISDAFGGVFVHSCGEWSHNAQVMAESGINYLGMDFCYPYSKIDVIQESLPNLVLQPGFEFFKKLEYADVCEFIEGMIQKRRGNTCLWFALNSNPIWPMDKVRRTFEKCGVKDISFGK